MTRPAAAALAMLGLVALAGPASAGTTIAIVNADDPGEGFNDPTPADPVGGNLATTLGEQRLRVFEAAAAVWAGRIDSDVLIEVEARFDPLPCSATSGTLGSAGPVSVFRDFGGATVPGTWHPVALASSLAGFDLSPGNPDVVATFSSTLGSPGCLGGLEFYLGFDGAGPGIDLYDVVIHEIGHGIGFATFVDPETGEKLLGRDDVFMRQLEDGSLGLTWDQLSDAERAASAIDTGDLLWVGPEVMAASDRLSFGADPSGRVRMFAPNPVNPGSSVSHWDSVLSPNELMEPFINSPPIQDPGLALELMLDIGWAPASGCLGDLDGDGATGGPDFGLFLAAFGTTVTAGAPGDFNGDGFIGGPDFGLFLMDFGCGAELIYP